MTASEFKTRWPEFNQIADSEITAALAEQTALVSDSWDATDKETVIGLKTAHALAVSPGGRNARLVTKDGSTTYSKLLRQMVRVHACGRSRVL